MIYMEKEATNKNCKQFFEIIESNCLVHALFYHFLICFSFDICFPLFSFFFVFLDGRQMMWWLSCANNGKWWITFEHTLHKPYAALWPMMPNEEWCGASMSSVKTTISLILQICNRYLIQLMESIRNYSTSIWHPSRLIGSRLQRQSPWSGWDNNISCGILTTSCITKSAAKRLAQCSLNLGDFFHQKYFNSSNFNFFRDI